MRGDGVAMLRVKGTPGHDQPLHDQHKKKKKKNARAEETIVGNRMISFV